MSLEFPKLFVHNDFNGYEITETINLNINKNCKDSLLTELKFEYPHIATSLELLYGHKEFDEYINKLIINDREHREGFPKHILSILLNLSRLHYDEFKFEIKKDIWDN